jgi:hypothetical protein
MEMNETADITRPSFVSFGQRGPEIRGFSALSFAVTPKLWLSPSREKGSGLRDSLYFS